MPYNQSESLETQKSLTPKKGSLLEKYKDQLNISNESLNQLPSVTQYFDEVFELDKSREDKLNKTEITLRDSISKITQSKLPAVSLPSIKITESLLLDGKKPEKNDICSRIQEAEGNQPIL